MSSKLEVSRRRGFAESIRMRSITGSVRPRTSAHRFSSKTQTAAVRRRGCFFILPRFFAPHDSRSASLRNKKWSQLPESNWRPSAYKAGALPTELSWPIRHKGANAKDGCSNAPAPCVKTRKQFLSQSAAFDLTVAAFSVLRRRKKQRAARQSRGAMARHSALGDAFFKPASAAYPSGTAITPGLML